MNSLETATTVKKISFLFFLALGVLHFVSNGLFAKQQWLPYSGITAKVLFIPFLAASLAYTYGIMKEHLLYHGKQGKAVDYIFLTVGVMALAALFIIQFSSPHA